MQHFLLIDFHLFVLSLPERTRKLLAKNCWHSDTNLIPLFYCPCQPRNRFSRCFVVRCVPAILHKNIFHAIGLPLKYFSWWNVGCLKTIVSTPLICMSHSLKNNGLLRIKQGLYIRPLKGPVEANTTFLCWNTSVQSVWHFLRCVTYFILLFTCLSL